MRLLQYVTWTGVEILPSSALHAPLSDPIVPFKHQIVIVVDPIASPSNLINFFHQPAISSDQIKFCITSAETMHACIMHVQRAIGLDWGYQIRPLHMTQRRRQVTLFFTRVIICGARLHTSLFSITWASRHGRRNTQNHVFRVGVPRHWLT
ncbi:hypothetical protein K504DRAFT_75427 [Pleomassaria siparia CBS 279.74]|uniref:Uncharacterized protein n=1 Tax=Pleomassaria siparia CBS 279.74 TaxID=1314801 RepID=A0A6G1K011_9PLEO|nr:hypothetical protein K504DRAFT_75427 [Pleomassaria siparia CBS 279.74]